LPIDLDLLHLVFGPHEAAHFVAIAFALSTVRRLFPLGPCTPYILPRDIDIFALRSLSFPGISVSRPDRTRDRPGRRPLSTPASSGGIDRSGFESRSSWKSVRWGVRASSSSPSFRTEASKARAVRRFACEGWRERAVPCRVRTRDARKSGAICAADVASAWDTALGSTSGTTGTNTNARAWSGTRTRPANVRRTHPWIEPRRRSCWRACRERPWAFLRRPSSKRGRTRWTRAGWRPASWKLGCRWPACELQSASFCVGRDVHRRTERTSFVRTTVATICLRSKRRTCATCLRTCPLFRSGSDGNPVAWHGWSPTCATPGRGSASRADGRRATFWNTASVVSHSSVGWVVRPRPRTSVGSSLSLWTSVVVRSSSCHLPSRNKPRPAPSRPSRSIPSRPRPCVDPLGSLGVDASSTPSPHPSLRV